MKRRKKKGTTEVIVDVEVDFDVAAACKVFECAQPLGGPAPAIVLPEWEPPTCKDVMPRQKLVFVTDNYDIPEGWFFVQTVGEVYAKGVKTYTVLIEEWVGAFTPAVVAPDPDSEEWTSEPWNNGSSFDPTRAFGGDEWLPLAVTPEQYGLVPLLEALSGTGPQSLAAWRTVYAIRDESGVDMLSVIAVLATLESADARGE